MQRWSIRFVIYRRGESFEAECIDASGVGVGRSVLEAVDDLVAMLNTLAKAAAENDAVFTVEPDSDELELFSKLESGQMPDEVAAFGTLSIAMGDVRSSDTTHLERMDLVGGPA